MAADSSIPAFNTLEASLTRVRAFSERISSKCVFFEEFWWDEFFDVGIEETLRKFLSFGKPLSFLS